MTVECNFSLNRYSLGVALLDLVKAFDKRRLSVPVFFCSKVKQFIVFQYRAAHNVTSRFLFIEYKLLLLSLQTKFSIQMFFDNFLHDLGLVSSFASC